MTTTVLLKDYNDNDIYNVITFKGYLNDEDIANIQEIIDKANDYFSTYCNAYGFLGNMYQTEYVLHELAKTYDFDEVPVSMAKTLYI